MFAKGVRAERFQLQSLNPKPLNSQMRTPSMKVRQTRGLKRHGLYYKGDAKYLYDINTSLGFNGFRVQGIVQNPWRGVIQQII